VTKLDYSKTNKSDTSFLNDPYWTNPKTGFDKAWHEQTKHKNARATKEKQFLGIHVDHELDRVLSESGPHAGKLICKTCNNKFLKWLPKEAC
jgi:hypothetical protein